MRVRSALAAVALTAAACITATLAIAAPALGQTGPPDAHPVSSQRGGFTLYSFHAERPAVAAAIRRQKPGIVRWFVEIDRYLQNQGWAAYEPFFRALADTRVRLVVQFWIKDRMPAWLNEPPTTPLGRLGFGPQVPRVDVFRRWVATLKEAVAPHEINTIWEAFNEPDLRWGSLQQWGMGATENYGYRWDPFASIMPTRGVTRYTGGVGTLWRQMHEALGDNKANSGIITHYANEVPWWPIWTRLSAPKTRTSKLWRDATAPLVDTVDIHWYGTTRGDVATYVNTVAQWVSLWEEAKGSPMRFFHGEAGPSADDTSWTIDSGTAARMRDEMAALGRDPRTARRYLGTVGHGITGSGRHLWESDYGWWDSRFDPNQSCDQEVHCADPAGVLRTSS